MAAPKERPPGHNAPGSGAEGACRLRMRVTPEAVIIVTKQNRIVLVDSEDWSMEDFNRKEIVEIILPEGFQSLQRSDVRESPEPASPPVEVIVGKPGIDPGAVESGEQIQVREAAAAARPIETSLVQAAEDGIICATADGAIMSWNSGAEKLFGYSQEEIRGKPLSVLIPYEHRSSEEKIRRRVLAGETMPPHDSSRIRKDRTAFAVSVAVSRVADLSGSTIGTAEIARDISAHQNVEKDLSAQVENLTQSNRELQDYAMVVAHDLQAPLNLVSRYFSDVSRKCGSLIDSETTELLTTAADALPRMQRLIKDLLEMARIDSRGINRVETDCAVVVAQALANLEIPIRECNARISVEPMPKILVDPIQFGQVIQNLVANAIKFRGDRIPEIHIGAEQRPGEWRFSVGDNGIGMEPEMIPRLFQPLQRLHGGGPYSGSGLGLAIAKKIMTRHGGRIWVESRPGAGSVFYLTVPVTEPKKSPESR